MERIAEPLAQGKDAEPRRPDSTAVQLQPADDYDHMANLFAAAPGEPPPDGSVRLLETSLSAPRNAGARAMALSRAQRQQGNRFVQRLVSRARRGGAHADAVPSDSAGEPLDAATRAYMEPRYAADLSDVRVHTDSQASASAQAFGARAYTTGRDIYFAAGTYEPATIEGRHLLAHELAHTLQQSGDPGQRSVARSPVRIGAVDDPLEKEAERAADLVTDTPGHGVAVTLAGGAATIQRKEKEDQHDWAAVVQITVVAGTVGEGSGIAETANHQKFPIDIEKNRLSAGHYVTSGELLGEPDWGSWTRIHSESMSANIFVYVLPPHVTLAPTVTFEVKPGPRTVREVWKDIQALPEDIQALVVRQHGRAATVEDYERALRIGRKLQLAGVSPDELYGFTKANGGSYSEQDIDTFLSSRTAQQAGRSQNIAERRKAEAGLFGREAFYKRYRDLLAGLKHAESLAAVAGTSIEVTGVSPDLINERDKLDADLVAAGLVHGIADFAKLIADYEKAFERETLAIALDILLKYGHLLHSEYDQFAPGKAGKGSEAAWMLAELDKVREPAQALYKQAAQEAQDGRIQDSDPWRRRAAAHLEAADKMVTGAAPSHAVVGWQDFPREKLLRRTTPEDVRYEMAWFIATHEAATQQAHDLLTDKPSRIYELDNLMAFAYEAQDIQKDSIQDLIIRDRKSQIESEKRIRDILLAVLAVALAVVSFGGGTVGLLAAGAAFGLGVVGAVGTVEEYDTKTTLYMAQLLREEPSAVWAIVAVISVGLDAAAVVQALKAVVPAAKAFSASGDLVELGEALAKVDARVSENVMKAARQVRAAEAQLKAASGKLKSLFTGAGSRVKAVPSLAAMAAQTGGEIAARLLAVTYYYIKTRVLGSFWRFVRELEKDGLIVWAELAPEEQNVIRQAFRESMELSRTGELAYGSQIYGRLSQRTRMAFTQETVDRFAAQGKALGRTDEEIIEGLESELQTQERVEAKIASVERPEPGGALELESEGVIGDPPAARPGLEKKFPLGESVGLPGHVRFHVEGINAIGDELNVVYAPSRFNISETALIENQIRAWRNEISAAGGELNYHFTVRCHVLGEFEGVTIKVLDSITWKLERRLPGTTKFETLFEHTGTP